MFKLFFSIPIHILAIVLGIMQIYLLIVKSNNYSLQVERLLLELFCSKDKNQNRYYSKTLNLYNTDDIFKFYNNTKNNYLYLNNKIITNTESNNKFINYNENKLKEFNNISFLDNSIEYNHYYNSLDKEDIISKMDVYYLNSTLKEYYVKTNSNDPFTLYNIDYGKFKEFIRNVNTIKNKFIVKIEKYFKFKIVQEYNFEKRGYITIIVNIMDISTYNISYIKFLIKDLYWIQLALLLISILNIFIIYYELKLKNFISKKYTKTNYYNYLNHAKTSRLSLNKNQLSINSFNCSNIIKKEISNASKSLLDKQNSVKTKILSSDSLSKISNNKNNQSEYEIILNKLSSFQKNIYQSQDFSFWKYFTLLAHIFQSLGCIYTLSNYNHQNNGIISIVLISFGCLTIVCSTGQYFEHLENYSLFYLTISSSLKMIGKIIISVLPVFFGFVFFGITVFTSSAKFKDFSTASMTLFALHQMDITLDIFNDMTKHNKIISLFFMISFWILVHILARRIFVVLIEDSYVFNQMKNKKSWLLKHIEFDTNQIGIIKDEAFNTEYSKLIKSANLIENNLNCIKNNNSNLTNNNKKFNNAISIKDINNSINNFDCNFRNCINEINALADVIEDQEHKINESKKL